MPMHLVAIAKKTWITFSYYAPNTSMDHAAYAVQMND
jgi:hypothetical protein